jgi:hypothetical protein
VEHEIFNSFERHGFDNRSLPEKANPLTADKEEVLQKKPYPLQKRRLGELRKNEPNLFRDTAELVNTK